MMAHGLKLTRCAHKCNQCGYSSITAVNLKNHLLVHSGEKPFACKQCKYSCRHPSALKSHMLSHSGEKPFICKQCNYSCTTASNLKTHMPIHSGEKPFTCTQCNFSCKKVDDFKKHKLKHDIQEKIMILKNEQGKLYKKRKECFEVKSNNFKKKIKNFPCAYNNEAVAQSSKYKMTQVEFEEQNLSNEWNELHLFFKTIQNDNAKFTEMKNRENSIDNLNLLCSELKEKIKKIQEEIRMEKVFTESKEILPKKNFEITLAKSPVKNLEKTPTKTWQDLCKKCGKDIFDLTGTIRKNHINKCKAKRRKKAAKMQQM